MHIRDIPRTWTRDGGGVDLPGSPLSYTSKQGKMSQRAVRPETAMGRLWEGAGGRWMESQVEINRERSGCTSMARRPDEARRAAAGVAQFGAVRTGPSTLPRKAESLSARADDRAGQGIEAGFIRRGRQRRGSAHTLAAEGGGAGQTRFSCRRNNVRVQVGCEKAVRLPYAIPSARTRRPALLLI